MASEMASVSCVMPIRRRVTDGAEKRIVQRKISAAPMPASTETHFPSTKFRGEGACSAPNSEKE